MSDAEKTLSEYQHVRTRLEMYLGSREPKEVTTLVMSAGHDPEIKTMTVIEGLAAWFREIVDNALDEIAVHGYGDTLSVTYDPEAMVFSVEDNGRGAKIHEIPAVGKGPAASYMFSHLMSGRNFGEKVGAGGTNGVGASVVNFTSEFFEVEIHRDNKRFYQKWTEGDADSEEPVTTKPSVRKKASTKTGTKITFKPSATVWHCGLDLPFEYVETRMWEIAISNPKIKVVFNGKKLKVPGRGDPVLNMFKKFKPTVFTVEHEDFKSRYYMMHNPGADDFIHASINRIPLLQAGDLGNLFLNEFCNTAMDALDAKTKKLIKYNQKRLITKKDLSGSLLVFAVAEANDVTFDSQAKCRVTTKFNKAIRAGFNKGDVDAFIKASPEWAKEVVARVQDRVKAVTSSNNKKKQDEVSRMRVAALFDASSRKRKDCTLFLTEGESAAAIAVAVRDPMIHAVLPLRGKILNVYRATPAQALASDTIVNIMSSIGLKIGTKAHRENLRFGRIFLATDADPDGDNITALLVNFFFKYWPELFDPDDPYIFHLETPLITLIKGKNRKYVYSDEDFDASKHRGWEVTRAKGLARLEQIDWKNVIKNPRLEPMVSDEHLPDIMNLLFDKGKGKADARKLWLEGNLGDLSNIDPKKCPTSEWVERTSRVYSIYVCKFRAIPKLSDGLKDVQRIAAYLMRNRTNKIKTVGLVGDMMAKNLYVHGDASGVEAVSDMASPFLNNHPLITGWGAFGSLVDPRKSGAPRYTEVSRSDFAVDNLYVDMDIAPMEDNYDGTETIVSTFLPRIPLVLLNGVVGLGVGHASKILPRKLSDLKQAVYEVLTTGTVENALMPHYDQFDVDIEKDPKVPNRYIISGKIERENTTTLHIRSIPPSKSVEEIRTRLIELEDNKEITTFEDHTSDQIDIVVKVRRSTMANTTDEQFIEMFDISDSIVENLTVITPDSSKIVCYETPQELVMDFVTWRLPWFQKRYDRLVEVEERAALELRYYVMCFKKRGRQPSIAQSVANIKSRKDMLADILEMAKSEGLPEEKSIAEKIAAYAVYRFTVGSRDEAEKDLKKSEKLITEYTAIRDSKVKQRNIYKKEVS